MYITREEWKKAFGMPTTPYDRLVGFECSQEYYNEIKSRNNPGRGFSIDYTKYYGRFGTPKPTFIASKLVIKDVIFNPPATIVFWNDGTKTVVKAHDEAFDWEKGLAMAICKKYLAGGKGRYYDIFRKYEEAGVDAAYKEAIKSLVTKDLLI